MAHARCPQCRTVSDFVVNDEDELRRRDRYTEDEDGYLQVDLCRVCGYGGIERSIDQGGYFNRELTGMGDEQPRMGRLCVGHCNRRVPRFLDLPANVGVLLRKWVKSGQSEEALRLLVESTGCPPGWARLWVEHPDGAIPEAE